MNQPHNKKKIMNKLMLASLLAITFLLGCTNDPPENQQQLTTTTTTGAAIDPATIKFICQSAQDPNMEADAPRHEVYLQIGSSKIKVADILNCEILAKEFYEQNQIPPAAIAAVGGWWAGAGDYLYIIEENGNYVVKKGFTGEELQNNDFGYKTIMTFGKDGNEVF